jgi:hypothetical protein
VSRGAGILIAALLAVQLILAFTSMRGDSATADEPAHVAAGYLKLTHGFLSFYRYNPPLADSIAALPLLAMRVNLPPDWRTAESPWNVGEALLFRSGNDADRLLFAARLPTLAMFAALSLLCAFAAWKLSGTEGAAVIAFALTALCPNLIAHGRLATNDMAATLFLFAAALLLLHWLDDPGLARALPASMVTAAALLTKVSSLIIVPWFAILLVNGLRRPETRLRALRSAAAGVLAVVAAIGAFYLFEMRGWWAAATYPDALRLTIPFREYVATCRVIAQFSASGFRQPQFLAGAFSTTGWREYYAVAFLLKTTIPALLLTVVALLAAFRQRRDTSFAVLALMLFVALYAVAASLSRLALGLRYILPICPFLYTAIAVVIAQSVRSAATARERRAMIGVVALLVAWHAGESVATFPNYIGYFNQAIGSRDNADRFLIDSNLDWGQDLRRLAAWVEANRIEQINVDYFGGSDVRYYLGKRALPLRGPDPRRRHPGWFAVSKHFLRISEAERKYGTDYDHYFAGAEKVATINGSIEVWRIR